jgi:hypothetical protein
MVAENPKAYPELEKALQQELTASEIEKLYFDFYNNEQSPSIDSNNNGENSPLRQEMLSLLEFMKVVKVEDAQEYFDEAEHQDGYEYWDIFQSLAEIFEDIVIYVQK